MANDKLREINVRVNVDLEDAIAGLKSLQREAKTAVKLLRELEGYSKGDE